MIKAIFFDLGGVLFTNGTKKFVEKISRQYGLSPEAALGLMDGSLGTKYREGKITRDEFWREVLKKLRINADLDQLETEWINEYQLIEETKELIKYLSDKYKLFYISDNVRERIDRIEDRFHFLEWFDGGVFSQEVGARKPSPKIYRAALQEAGVRGSEVIFIDDKEKSLPPAQRMGMTTVLFKSPEDLKEQLKKLGII